MITKQSTSIRLDSHLHTLVMREAKKSGLSFSGVVHLLLQAFVQGNVRVGVFQHSDSSLRNLEKESQELSDLYRKKKMKGYSSAKELFHDILD